MTKHNPILIENLSLEAKRQDLRCLESAMENLRKLISYDPENPNLVDFYNLHLIYDEDRSLVKVYLVGFCNQIQGLSPKKDQIMDLYSHIPWNLIKELDQNLDGILSDSSNLSIISQDLKLLYSELERIVAIEKIKNPGIFDDKNFKIESFAGSSDLSFLDNQSLVDSGSVNSNHGGALAEEMASFSGISGAPDEVDPDSVDLDYIGMFVEETKNISYVSSVSDKEEEFLAKIFKDIDFKSSGVALCITDLKKESAKSFFKKYNDRFANLVLEFESIDLEKKSGREAALAIIQSIGEQARNILLLSDVIADDNYRNFLKDLKKFRDVLVHDIYDWDRNNPDQYSKFRQFIEQGDVSFLEKVSNDVFNLKRTGSKSAISQIISHIKQNFLSNEKIEFSSLETVKQMPSLNQEEINWMIDAIKNSLPESLREDQEINKRIIIVRNLFSERYPLPRITSELDKLFGENLTNFIKQDIEGLESWGGVRAKFEISRDDDKDVKKQKASDMVRYDGIVRKVKDKCREISDEKFKTSSEIGGFQKSVSGQEISNLTKTSLDVYSKIITDSLRSIQQASDDLHSQAKRSNVAVRDLVKGNAEYQYSVLFHLNAIGQAIYNLTSRKEFIAVASDELKQEFSRLRKIRNAIAHDYEIGGSASDISYYGNDLLLGPVQMSALRVFDSVQYLHSISRMIEDAVSKIVPKRDIDSSANDSYRRYELIALLERAFDNRDENSMIDLLHTIFLSDIEKCADIFAFADKFKSDSYLQESEIRNLQTVIDQGDVVKCKKLLIKLNQNNIKSAPESYARKYLGKGNFIEVKDLVLKRKELNRLCHKYKIKIDGIGGKILKYSWMEGDDSFLLVSCHNDDDLAGFKKELHDLVGTTLKVITEGDVREYFSHRDAKKKSDKFLESAKKIKLENLFDGYELYSAVEKGDLKQVKKIIKTGRPLLDINVKGYTPLHIASMTWATNYDRQTAINICRELLKAGANPNLLDKHGCTILHNGAEANCYEICRLAIEHKVNQNIKNKHGKTALDLSSDHGEEGMVYQYLASQEVDPIKKLISAINQGDVKTIKEIVSKIDLNKKTDNNELILNIACQSRSNKRLQIVKILLKNGARPNLADDSGDNAVDCALNHSDDDLFDLVDFLIKSGARISKKAIFSAIFCDDEKVVGLLIENGSDINFSNSLGTPLLHLVNIPAGNFREAEAKILKILIENKADLNVQDEYVGNALHLAAERGNKVAVEILLKAGIDKNLQSEGKSFFGKTAYEIALSEGHQAIADFITNYKSPDQKPSPVTKNKSVEKIDYKQLESQTIHVK